MRAAVSRGPGYLKGPRLMARKRRKTKFKGIRLTVIGDSNLFAPIGKSMGYAVEHGDSFYLVDIGAPPFYPLGEEKIRNMKGIVCTHSHEDHRRWFTDLALFLKYHADSRRLPLFTTDEIHGEYEKNSRGALERSLTADSKRVIELSYDLFVEKHNLGPRAKYRIGAVRINPKDPLGGTAWRVVDLKGRFVPPSKAKIVINHHEKANRPRMLFRNEATREWVEPSSFYDFSDTTFYEKNQNLHVDETGMAFRATMAHSWHGPPTIGVQITLGEHALMISADTMYDPDLWKQLASERLAAQGVKRARNLKKAYIIDGDINDFIERTWSERRYKAAMNNYDGYVLLHDTWLSGGVVHTDYAQMPPLNERLGGFTNGIANGRLMLDHSPDYITSEMPLTTQGKTFRIIGTESWEETEGKLYPFCADFYTKKLDRTYVGFKDPRGAFKVVRDGDGVLHCMPVNKPSKHEKLARIDLFRDILGIYLPYLKKKNEAYHVRPDGKIEKVAYGRSGSTAKIVKSVRTELTAKRKLKNRILDA